MTPTERARFDGLSLRVEVLRGFAVPAGRRGIAWTLDRQRAAWFARAPGLVSHLDGEPGGPWVASATVRRERILAYLDRRGESEVVIPSLRGVRVRVDTLHAQEGG